MTCALQRPRRWASTPAIGVLVSVLLAIGCAPTGPRDPFLVVFNGQLGPNIALAVDSSAHKHDWVATDNAGKHIDVAYASGESWGLVQLKLGIDSPTLQPREDFSRFNTIQLLLGGEWGDPDATIELGIQGTPDPAALPTAAKRVQLPAHPAGRPRTYYQIDLGLFDRDGEASPRKNLLSPATFYFSGGCGSFLEIFAIALFEDIPSCCASICTEET